ncbi:MAG TPA: ABC transporter ATP-binding protein [Candidatus Limnocylindrales bacterium]|nr:ABC transporter ATP-binding protein [Candidatus Limnocylindrales bacterium]
MSVAVGSSIAAAAPAATPAIRMRGLRKRFGEVVALDGLDLDVPVGSVFGLLGPNGAGKTTAIRLLTALARPTGGSVRLFGVAAGEVVRAGRVGYLPQEPRFYDWIHGRELLDLVARLHGLADRHERTERVAAALRDAELAAAADRAVGTYSGGMRQRLGIAQALLHDPDLLVLDEPVSSLDPAGRREVLRIVAGLRGRVTVLLSTHVLSDVERVCDRVAILDRGRLVAEGELERLLADHATTAFRLEPEPGQGAAVAALENALGGQSWARRVERAGEAGEALLVVTDDPGAGVAILRLALEAGVAPAAFAHVRPTLEDVFLDLVGHPVPEDLDGRGFVRPRTERDA